jgi:hypothetical protein
VGELISTGVLVAVALLLAAGALRQFGQLGPRGVLLDALALLPQWKFFAQHDVGEESAFDDFHLLARTSDGEWGALLWPDERLWHEVLWNPQQVSRAMLTSAMIDLAQHPDAAPASHSSLILARYALARKAGPLQLAVATTRGRGVRGLRLVWLSHWYQP